jgi:hypothetical protein
VRPRQYVGKNRTANDTGSLAAELIGASGCGAEILGEFDKQWMQVAFRYFDPAAMLALDSTEPFARELLGLAHVHADAKPAGIGTPSRSLTACTFNQA